MELKPQEILVLFKVAAHPERTWTYASLAASLHISDGEAHASVKRARVAGLATADDSRKWAPVRSALLEFAIHGAKYAFPAIEGPIKRGVPTSYGAPPLVSLINSTPGNVPVWPHPKGRARGPSLTPIYRTAALAAMDDPVLHEWLALLDAIRAGRARERALGRKLLSERLGVPALAA